MPRKTFFDESHVEPVENLLKAGLSYRQIAIEFGCEHHTVSAFVRKHLPDWHERYSGQHTRPPGMRILILDIETCAGTTRFWHTSEKFIRPEYVVKDTEVFCFVAKWLGEEALEFRSAHHDGRQKMLERAHALLSEADGVVTYNGARFDLPHLNLGFLRSGMKPPAPYKSIDLLQTIRKKFRFTNNRLQRVSKTLGIGSKVEHEGWALWEKCEAGDESAWARMREYNEGDVKLTEDLYLWLLPWIEGHPSYAALHCDERCPNCGHEEYRQDRYYRTKTGTYPRYQCSACGKWFRAARRVFHTEITETAMS
ncbi:MAG: ribonuclease H-like domain-containing protein [Solirubrobacteraceae bacterium]